MSDVKERAGCLFLGPRQLDGRSITSLHLENYQFFRKVVRIFAQLLT